MQLTVTCVLKSGGIYDASWVARLRAGVATHLPVPHRFVCLSDVDVPCERIPLEHDWPGWWSKIELFKLSGPVLYFDLDTAIVGDLTDIAYATVDSAMVMLSDFYRPQQLASGVMAWGFAAPTWVYEKFCSNPESAMREFRGGGDQSFIECLLKIAGLETQRRWDLMCPGQIVSYKVHCCGVSPITGRATAAVIPENARVVCLHGHPKFADMPANDPVRQVWERAA